MMTNVNINSFFLICKSNVVTHECDSTAIEMISLNHLKSNLTAEKEKNGEENYYAQDHVHTRMSAKTSKSSTRLRYN